MRNHIMLEKHEVALLKSGQTLYINLGDQSFGLSFEAPKYKQKAIEAKPKDKVSFPCEFCNKSYLASQSLSVHQRVKHDNLKRFKCKHCNKSWIYKKKYKRHNEIFHHGRKS